MVFTEKLAYNRLVDHLQKCGLFSDFRYGFRSSRLTTDFLTFVSDGIARVFNRSGATGAVALDISKVFNKVWHAGPLPKLKSYEISGQAFALPWSFFSNRWLQVYPDYIDKNIQLILEFLKAPFLVLHSFYYTLMTFLMMFSVLKIPMLMILLSTLSVIRHLTCDNN